MKKVLVFFISLLLLVSCGDSCDESPDISRLKKEVKFERLDLKIRNTDSFEALKKLLHSENDFKNIIIPQGMPFDEIAYKLYQLGKDSLLDSLYTAVDSRYTDNGVLESDLSDLFARTAYHFPDFRQPKVKGFVSAFGGYDLVETDSTILVGLEYFLGPKPVFFDNNFPAYILKYYTKEQLPLKIAMTISSRFNAFDFKDKTVLAHMIFYGKAFYFTKKMLPCAKDSAICEYGSEEIQLLEDDPAYVWEHFVSHKLFYNTDREAIKKYIDDRPKTFEIGQNCPGRVGRWLGYEIVKSYMKKHPEISLRQLMEETDAKKIFNESHYRPK